MNPERTADIDNYLFGEMSKESHDTFEDQLLSSDELFYEVAERENELVDGFVHGKLESEVEKRFRSSLSRFPARQKKIANAATLQAFIKNEVAPTPATEKVPWYQRLGFAFRVPAFVASALGILLIGLIGLLLVQNSSLNSELAKVNSTNINQLRQREAELQAEIESLRTASGDLMTDLGAERERREGLETELEDLRRQIGTANPTNDSPVTPTIATLILRPSGIRGGPDAVRKLRIDNDEKRVALKIFLPGDATDGTFSVRVNDVSVGSGIKPIMSSGDTKSISAAVTSESFRNGLNRVEVVDSGSKVVSSFAVLCERGPVR